MATATVTPAIQELTQALNSIGLPSPSPSFLTPILNPINNQRTPPLAALIATAKHRLLSSDISQPHTLDSTKNLSLPLNITSASITSKTLTGDVPVQVLDIQDLGKSKWEQIEALEAERKGETTKGREVIRVVAPADGNDAASSAAGSNATNWKSHGPFKLLLQDMTGQRVYGFELKRVEKIEMPGSGAMGIGCKIMLKKGTRVARGLVLLEPLTTVVLGGKIEALDKSWREGRERALRGAIGDVREV